VLRIRLALAPLVLLVITACGTSGAAGTPEVTEAAEIEVEVDIMSGVPNPGWTVGGSEAAALTDLINALPESGQAEGKAGQDLGFRGFVLRGGDLFGADERVRVLGSAVVVSDGTTPGRLYTDENRAIFTMLRTMSAEHLNENVLQAIPVDGLKGS
jgi:hypothetical protein